MTKQMIYPSLHETVKFCKDLTSKLKWKYEVAFVKIQKLLIFLPLLINQQLTGIHIYPFYQN